MYVINEATWQFSDDPVIFPTIKLTGICYSWIKKAPSRPCRYLKTIFKNKLDKHDVGITTQEWFDLFLDERMKNKIISYEINEDTYEVIFDLQECSKEWLLSLITLFRYPSEYHNVCYNTKQVLIRSNKKVTQWEALFKAHQGYYRDYYYLDKYREYRYAQGHSLFAPGNSAVVFDVEKVFSTLDSYTKEWDSKRLMEYAMIHPIWLCGAAISYGSMVLF